MAVFLVAPVWYSPDLRTTQGLVVLLSTLPAFWLVSRWSDLLYGAPENYFFARLPVENRRLFDYGWRRFLRSTMTAAILYALLGASVIVHHSLGAWAWAALLLWLILQWGTVVGFVLLLQDSRPPLPLIPAGGWLWLIRAIHLLAEVLLPLLFVVGIMVMLAEGLVLQIVHSDWGRVLVEELVRVCEWLGLLLPWGWPTTFMHDVFIRRNGWMLLLLLPMVGWFYLGCRTWLFLRDHYRGPWEGEDPTVASYYGRVPAESEEESGVRPAAGLVDDPQLAQPPPSFALPGQGASAFTAYVRQRKFLEPQSWGFVGWLERWIFRWFTPRQELILQMLLLGPPRWSAGWRKAWFVVMGVWAALLAMPVARYWVIVLGIVFIAATAWPVLGGHWPGLAPVYSYRHGFSLISFYPVSFREMARVMYRCNLMRMLAATPIWLALGGIAAPYLNYPIGLGMEVAAKFVLWGLAIQPTVFVFRMAAVCGNDRRFPRLGKLPPALWLLVLLSFSPAIFIVPEWWGSLLAALLLHGGSWLFYLIFRRRFERMKMDWAASVEVTREVAAG